MTSDPTFEIEMSPVPLQPKPAACQDTTIASFAIAVLDRVWGLDMECVVVRSCSHEYFRAWRIPWPLPAIGEEAMSCGGPPVVTLESGRGDKSVPALKKGKRWIRMKGAA